MITPGDCEVREDCMLLASLSQSPVVSPSGNKYLTLLKLWLIAKGGMKTCTKLWSQGRKQALDLKASISIAQLCDAGEDPSTNFLHRWGFKYLFHDMIQLQHHPQSSAAPCVMRHPHRML